MEQSRGVCRRGLRTYWKKKGLQPLPSTSQPLTCKTVATPGGFDLHFPCVSTTTAMVVRVEPLYLTTCGPWYPLSDRWWEGNGYCGCCLDSNHRWTGPRFICAPFDGLTFQVNLFTPMPPIVLHANTLILDLTTFGHLTSEYQNGE